ncbi:hypothetical protein [Tissierella praeacuta]|uniref:hypothetical protein n=1 Tax=Tissierella praeacuta TaxID=43131 RepID=UPI003342CB15
MKIIEMKLTADKENQIILQAEAMRIADLKPGDEVYAIMVMPEEVDSPMLVIAPQGMEAAVQFCKDDDEDEIQLPHALLEEAGIPVDSNLEIICGNGEITIRPSDLLNQLPDELRRLFDNLGINPDTVREIMKKEGYFV